MFKPKKPHRLSRNLNRLILCTSHLTACLFIIAFALFWFTWMFELSDQLAQRFTLAGMPFLVITFIASFFEQCPHCGKHQIIHARTRRYIEKKAGHEHKKKTFKELWNAPDGGYCIWCDQLMEFDDEE